MSLSLSKEIISTDRALETLNVELEQRVDERTVDLSAANCALQEAKNIAFITDKDPHVISFIEADKAKDLFEAMRIAVQGGYMERLSELVRSVTDQHPVLARQLLEKVDQYDYASLSNLFLEDGNGEATQKS